MEKKWTVLKGWKFCQAGQGKVLKMNATEKEAEQMIKRKEYGKGDNRSLPRMPLV